MSDITPLLILGTGVFAEEVADIVSDIPDFRLDGFVANMDRDRAGGTLLGLPVHWVDDLAGFRDTHRAVCAIGSTRRSLFTGQAESYGIDFATVVHPSAHVSRASTLGPGCILSPGVIVASHTAIGPHVIVNRNATVGHHTTVGGHVTIGPAANVAGLCNVGDGAYVAMGANIIDRINVGADAVVGAGAVVVKDVPARTMVLGVPARVVKENIERK